MEGNSVRLRRVYGRYSFTFFLLFTINKGLPLQQNTLHQRERKLLISNICRVFSRIKIFSKMSCCGGCKMYPDMGYTEKTTSETLIMGVAPEKASFEDGSEMGVGAENGCKCGDNCTCDPCNCK